jgi:deoxyribonuclease-4
MIGFHLSIAGGVAHLRRRFVERGCGALQMFTSSPRTWATNPWKDESVRDFRAMLADLGGPPVVVHTRYLLNLAAANDLVRQKSVATLRFEYEMAAAVGADFLVLHMGSHADKAAGLAGMIANLNESLTGVAVEKPLLLLENTASEKNDLGADLAEIQRVRDGITFPSGVCLDTCHAFQAGYDLRTAAQRDELAGECRRVLGPRGVRVIHVNDSKNPFCGKHDRHEGIGLGEIGADHLAAFLLLPEFQGLPAILETPQAGPDDPSDDLANIERLQIALQRQTNAMPVLGQRRTSTRAKQRG